MLGHRQIGRKILFLLDHGLSDDLVGSEHVLLDEFMLENLVPAYSILFVNFQASQDEVLRQVRDLFRE